MQNAKDRSNSYNHLCPHQPWVWWLWYTLVTASLYFVVTHFPIDSPRIISASALDRAIPFVPSTVWLYLSYFALLPALIIFTRHCDWFLPVFMTALFTGVLCLVWHLFVPTMVIRPELTSVDTGLLALMYANDTALAAFPSGHIALPVSLAVACAYYHRRWACVFLVWSGVLAIVVITTRQHVVYDVVAGAVVGGVIALGMRRFVLLGVDLRTLLALSCEWLVILCTFVLALRLDTLWMYALAAIIIASRQHGLLILYHDAVHGLIARRTWINDAVINVCIGVPSMLPVEVYRVLHIEHHRSLGTENDPERRYMFAHQPWNYRPLPKWTLTRQLLGDLFVVNGIKTIQAWQREAAPLNLPVTTWVISAVYVILLVGCLWIAPKTTVTGLILWFGPLLTLANLLQKLRSYAEHSAGPGITPEWPHWTYSFRPGLLGRLTVWPYHINYHLEHHRTSDVPWHSVPSLVSDTPPHPSSSMPGKALWQLLYKS